MSASMGVERRKIRVAVVGCGEFGRNHARAYRELVGVFDQDADRAAKVAQEFQTRAFFTPGELRGAVEAATVAVPTIAHKEVGCALQDMGIDVLVEKPMASTLAEADELIAAAKRNSRILQVGH